MGRDLTLYPKKATKRELKLYLEGLRFRRCSHLWDWPAGTLNYCWFDDQDFNYIDGVSADVYPVSGEETAISGNPWALHVRNLYSASWYDVRLMTCCVAPQAVWGDHQRRLRNEQVCTTVGG